MEKIRNLYNFLNYYSSILIDNMKNNVAYSLIVISIILSILFCDKFTFFILGIIVYILYLKKEKFEFEKRKFEIDSIDLRFMNVDNPESISKILDNYIEDCFNRDVLFPRGLKKDEYINATTEREMLDALLDSVTNNISVQLRNKLDLYYGKDRTDIIIGRKCFVYVSLFAANSNKSTYNLR